MSDELTYQKQALEDRATIKHLENVIENLAILAQERIDIEKCFICGYYEKFRDVTLCDICDNFTCNDCLGDEPCCSDCEDDEGEDDDTSSSS